MKRKHMGTWINTGLYAQMWQAIAVNGDHADYDWTVKVDANCEFFLHQLVDCIKLLPAALTDAFHANCEGVEYGFFGVQAWCLVCKKRLLSLPYFFCSLRKLTKVILG